MTKIRGQTDYEGVVEQSCSNLPYGDGKTCGPSPAEDLFAGLQQDSESGLDHALYRQYSSTFGSWTTPDPYSGSYDIFNPQSMNRYAYVGGSPFAGVDPSRLDDCSWDPDGILGCRLSNNQAAAAIGVSAVSSNIPLLSTILSSPVAVLACSAAVFGNRPETMEGPA